MSQKTINIGYARVSTHKQDLGLKVQIEALKHCDKLFIEKNLVQITLVLNSQKP